MRADLSNSRWQGRVKNLLRAGYGADDIALQLDCAPETVRTEIRILRATGDLEEIYMRQRHERRRDNAR